MLCKIICLCLDRFFLHFSIKFTILFCFSLEAISNLHIISEKLSNTYAIVYIYVYVCVYIYIYREREREKERENRIYIIEILHRI
jgi:amino acid transporter